MSFRMEPKKKAFRQFLPGTTVRRVDSSVPALPRAAKPRIR
jgi:hypothetical protein